MAHTQNPPTTAGARERPATGADGCQITPQPATCTATITHPWDRTDRQCARPVHSPGGWHRSAPESDRVPIAWLDADDTTPHRATEPAGDRP